MPILIAAPAAQIIVTRPRPRFQGQGYAWAAVLIGSRLPEIACHELGISGGMWVPLGQTAVLVLLAIIAARLCPIKNLASFILAVAALSFCWLFAGPWLNATSVVRSASHSLGLGGQLFLSRAVLVTGAVLMLCTLIGSGIGRRELFLRAGNWWAPAQPEPYLFLRRPVPWARFAAILLLIYGVALPLYLFFTLHPHFGNGQRLLPLIPWAIATSILNAANEEFQFRSVLLARLNGVVPQRQAMLLTAVLFGVSHYFGQPSGWGGVLMAGTAGWIWAKCMIETRGFTCAFAIHFVQDLVVFAFVALAAAA
ncbi:MAG: protease family protein [Verrucomicrobiota bacterium]|jgi:membrane protease YdiL (CAAX protease family)